ncbi:MAG: AAA family ATPase [Ruminococcaceae bacterium]|nr:AAA family ATPase [Oscillospiraceae bacterium]
MMKMSVLYQYIIDEATRLRTADGRSGVTADYFLLALLQTLHLYQTKDPKAPMGKAFSALDTLAELSRVNELLGAYPFDHDEAIRALTAVTRRTDYNASMEELMFMKFGFTVQMNVKKEKNRAIRTDDYLKLILAEPSAAIKANVIHANQKAAGATEPAPNTAAKTTAEPKAESKKAGEKAKTEPKTEGKKAGAKSKPKTESKKTGAKSKPKTESKKAEAKAKTEPKAEDTDDELMKSLEAFFAEEDEEAPAPAPKKLSGKEQLCELVENTRKIQNTLLEVIYGQDQAVNAFASGYFQAQMMALSRKENTKPQATFLFAGPPGVGKTFLAETAAAALGLPFRRFDMSEYADKEANIEFCGSDKVYKNGKEGNVTGFVEENPRCVLLFDEIEKAHPVCIYLFLQILDAGRLRDNYTDTEVSFSEAILIFTTNVGKNLYADPTVANLSTLPRKTILKALAADKKPDSDAPLFPAAICSRFASGNVVMFNHLGAANLYTIADRELHRNLKGFEKATGIRAEVDDRIATALMLAEGGKADARTVKGRANAFFHEELYEMFRLLSSERHNGAVEKFKTIRFSVSLDNAADEIKDMFVNSQTPEVLVFADPAMQKACRAKLGSVICHTTDNIEQAKELLFNYDISLILCDVRCRMYSENTNVLNAEDIRSVGRDFLTYVLGRYTLPVYLIQEKKDQISNEEFLSFAKTGVRELLTVGAERNAFAKQVQTACNVAYQQNNMLKLARANKVLTYKTSQSLADGGETAEIHISDFKLNLATDTEDSKNILDNVSKPDLHFEDVIGAEEAKSELSYFVSYLKDPIKYLRRGVRAPKGVLLYGPPGTGKTLLAKAMAGESDVTFLTAEGNQFLKRFVGEGPDAVHALFRSARKYAPSILFIDEIDAIGKDRNSALQNDNSSDVLTAFLTEMDGFNTDTSKPVFVLAATNYDIEPGKGKSLDAALLRRFDRRIYVDLPNKDERRRFLEMKVERSAGTELSAEQIENIAVRSTGMSLADLESVFEMALRNAIRSEDGVVGDEAFEEAFETFQGGEKKTWSAETLTRTARHEAGHALLCWLSGEKPTYLTIVARGNHGGYMQHGNQEDKAIFLREELRARIRTALGGRAAETVYYGPEDGVSTGAGGDLHSATQLAVQMVCNYGMDEEIGLTYLDPDASGAACTELVRARVKAILDEEMEKAVAQIEANRKAVDQMVEVLLKKNHLREQEIDAIFTKYAR